MNKPAPRNYLTHPKGISSWLFTPDHKRIGILYLIVIMLAFAAGEFLALALRMELFNPGEQLIGQDTYNKFFTLNGAIMIFLFLVPAIPAILGNFFLLILIGAKDVAFPKLNLARL